ncbi:MAG: hypothetical protein R3C11_20405 [Planctomycetaceae bacterium]
MELSRSFSILGSLILLVTLSACDPPEQSATPSGTKNSTSSDTNSSKSDETETVVETKAPVERPPQPILEGWEKPAVAFVLSGEQNGYLEPCGCSETQSGGMARRADLFAQIKAKEWPLTRWM